MKNIKFIITAACIVLFTACQDKGEWDVPAQSAAPQYGNNSIVENNVKSIKDVITTYASTIANDDMVEITQDLQVRGRVTGNDISGNFYKKITIQDEPANSADARALTISIDESGIWGYLALGQEVVVDLKGLWIGGYGKTPTIGTPYTNAKGATSVGRMSKHLWNKHFKIVGNIKTVDPMVITKNDLSKLNEMENGVPKHAGKLLKFSNVTFVNADGVSTFKSGTESNLTGYFIQCLNEFFVSGTDDKKQTVQVFTSGDYAKFSSMILPYDQATEKAIPCDLIGIGGYYNGLWQISIIETSGIIVPSSGDAPTPTPTPTGTTYSPVTSIAEGTYVFGATVDSKVLVAVPLADSKTYGYLGQAEATEASGSITTDAANEFTLKAVTGGYTIQSPDGRYLYMSGTYNSFNVDATAPSEGHIWTVTFNADGTANVVNTTNNKTLQYSTQYTSWGAYSSVTNTLPKIYKKNS